MSYLIRSRAICHTAHRFIALFAGTVASFMALAQGHIAPPIGTNAPPPNEMQVARPQIIVRNGANQPIQLRAVKIDAEITGTIAQITTELRFYNPNQRVLEGELQFPLADAQTITGFAMDVDGKLRDAVPVDKPRAQTVFEDITRQNIDPGLLQVTQGNNFKLRVYPIGAQQEKFIRIRTIESLGQRGTRRIFRLPVDFGVSIDHFTLAIRAAGNVPPRLVRGSLADIAFARTGDHHRATVERQQFKTDGPLEFALDAPERASLAVGEHRGTTYFHVDIPVKTTRVARPAPPIVGLIWDSSGSAAARDRTREMAFLDAFMQRARNLEVRLIRLRDRAEPAESFRIIEGNWHPLRAAIEATPYDGATNFGTFAADATINEYLLVSDGLGNFGESAFPATNAAVHTLLSAVKADAAALRFLAERSGGRFIELAKTTAQDATTAILSTEERVESITSHGATDLVSTSRFAQQGTLSVAGVLRDTRTVININLTNGKIARTLEVPIDATARDSMVAPWLWARARISILEGEASLHRGEIRRLGQHFGIPTRETSLIVLDRVADYERYAIEPPIELRAEYERLRATTARTTIAQKQSQIDRVVAMFREKETWWIRTFPKDDRRVEAKLKDTLASEGRADPSPADRLARRERIEESRAPKPASPALQIAPRELGSGGTSARGLADAEPAAADGVGARPAMAIQLKTWTPQSAYGRRLREARTEDLYRIYLDERPTYVTSTAFFLDAADLFFKKGLTELGLRVLSNLAEMDLENRHILRILGYRLMQANEAALAVAVFKKVLEISPDEPQSYRDLGLALAANKHYQQAIDALYEVIERPWHGRFPEVELIALAELNAIRATARVPLDTSRMDTRLLKNLPLDLRVVLAWDADNTDIDLWVTDPNGEKCYYGNRVTYQGGRMSQDFTGGYGPEEFSLKFAKPGKYKVEAQFYGHRQQIVAGATTLSLQLSTKFGTHAQSDKAITLRLTGQRELVQVGEFEVQ
jgi:Ca-activated chloride channel homolog